ncbi:MotA/TolQ/ExbB proton channel family protein [Luteolibacter ambystomatis]|uniref:MotA/TolQ/ExbB proton channel family protein n=1 Tax=Luteolibacter ambystomatis TaxID=2824561 RepID=A0A975J162_9BACT|nr:MotA/TolQ/ExbB proton channel family protein [Luteolibacter ambystomatis]QUE52094.1 MotA/TolQ/ExbB proton channel family protein [Luteolibacter ambystomatis]
MKKTIKVVALATLLLSPFTAFAAEGGAPAAHGGGTNKSFIEVLKEGGWCMYPIGLCSVATVWLIIDVWLRTNKPKLVPEDDLAVAQQSFRSGDYVGAYQAMKASNSPFASVVRAGLSSVGYGKDATEEAIVAAVDKINSTLQTRINYLSVIGVCTPMIGLLGTVSGMRGAFATLGSSGIGDPSTLSAHIGEVLIATASGLFIAIPAFMGFYFLKNKLQSGIHGLEEEAERLFRNAPYEYLQSADVGQEETFAALPNWIEAPAG